jgi:flagellin
MSLRINTNVTAMNALRNLEGTSNAVAGSIEKLSSGLRINGAADDPAGLIISEGLRAQVDGLNQAVSNAQDANNLIKTAEGALTEVNSLLRSVRQLAVHAANTGVNDVSAVQADQTQIQSAIESIDRIANQTQFGAKKLLDGSSGINASVVDTKNVSGAYIGGTIAGVQSQDGTVSVTVSAAATRASATGNATYASVNATVSTVNGTTTGSGGTLVLNGQSITVTGSDTVQTLIDKVNNLASVTGVSANFSSANGSGTIVLTQRNYGSNFKIVAAESASLFSTSGAGTSVAGLNATVTVKASGLVNGSVQTVTSTFTGGRSSADSGLRVSDTYGNSILLSEAGNDTGISNQDVARVTAGALAFQIGANAGQFVSTSLGNSTTSSLGATTVAGKTLKTIDVTTAQGAQDALKVLDESIAQVSKQRAQLGAFQKNTLDSTVRFLGVSIENLSASESQVRDTNVAQEVVKMTKNQILQQAGISQLAQANASSQMALSLLR